MKVLLSTCFAVALSCVGAASMAGTVTRYQIDTNFPSVFNFITNARTTPGGSVSGFFDFIIADDGTESIGDFAFTLIRPEFSDPVKQTSSFNSTTGTVNVVSPEQRTDVGFTNFGYQFVGQRFSCRPGSSNAEDAVRLRVFGSTLGTNQLTALVTRLSGDPDCPDFTLADGTTRPGNGSLGSSANGSTTQFSGVTSSLAPVPLPASGLLLLAALGGVARLRKRRG